MTGIISVNWRIEPVTPPRPLRYCSTCGGTRLFRSSGRIRLNANGRRLDAWLIYKCVACDRTWNLPLVERAAVTSVAEADLQAMHRSDPTWVRAREFDLSTLGRHCDQIDTSSELTVTKTLRGAWMDDWSVVEIAISSPGPTGQRLDRLLANELKVTRPELQAMFRAGGLKVDSASDRVLRRPVRGRFTLWFIASSLTDGQRATLSGSFLGGHQEVRR